MIWDELFEVQRELGGSRRVVLNYSSLAYREIYDLAENMPLNLYWAVFGTARGKTNARNMRATLERIKAAVEG